MGNDQTASSQQHQRAIFSGAANSEPVHREQYLSGLTVHLRRGVSQGLAQLERSGMFTNFPLMEAAPVRPLIQPGSFVG